MNKCTFLGRLTKEPTIRNTQNGGIVYSNSLAVTRKFKREGEPDTDFINLTAFGKTAEFMQKYMSIKGQQILVETHLQNRTWDDENGVKHYATDFIVEQCYFADTKKDNNEQHPTSFESQMNNIGVTVNNIPSPIEDPLPF